MRPRVLQFIGSFHQGGSERQAIQLTRLLSSDNEFEVFAATLDASGVLEDEINAIGLPEIPEFKLTSFYDLNFFTQLRRCVGFLIKNEISVVHCHDFYTNVFGIIAARIAGVDAAIASKRETGGMRTPKQDKIEKWIFGRSSGIVVNSAAVRDYLAERGIPKRKIELIYNGLDTTRFGTGTVDRPAVANRYGLPTDAGAKFITLVANLRHTVKNHPMLLRAANRVAAKHPNAHFIFAGEGPLKSEMEKMAADLGIAENAHFIGGCSDVPALLSLSDIGVLTSFAEGFSNSIIEYMAAGLPVIATDVGGASEVIVNGDNGFVVDSDDDEALSERLIELLSDDSLTAKMGERGRMMLSERFSLDAQLKNTTGLYNRLLNR